MSRTMLYLDSSAIVKTVMAEEESEALRELLRAWPHRVSSALARVEVPRALRRAKAPGFLFERAQQVLLDIVLISMDEAVLEMAGALEPPALRALDAIHLATALSVKGDLQAFITYDQRLTDAASQAGLSVWAPGSSRHKPGSG